MMVSLKQLTVKSHRKFWEAQSTIIMHLLLVFTKNHTVKLILSKVNVK